jgi:hypothetical protein
MSESGRYLFAVTRGLSADVVADTQGLRDAPLGLVPCGELQAVVCTVDLAEFGEEPLRRHLEDLAWVEELARTHDEVVRTVARRSTVAPMRLVTIYADDLRVQEQIGLLHDDLVAALDRVEGCAEWSVKVYAEVAEQSRDQPARERATSGAAYLQRKRDQATARQSADEESAEVARRIHDALAGLADAARTLAPQDPRLSGRSEPMVHNGAYLVPDEHADSFRTTVESLTADHPGMTVEVQGPWPPYSFAVLEA